MEPRVFIGASVESQKLVDALIRGLEYDARLVPWYNAFPVGLNGIDALLAELKNCHFGIFVFAPDDAARMRENDYLVARDNVVFEAGLFMGLHGKGQTFIITPRNLPSFHLASDFLGITTAKYNPAHASDDPLNAMAPAVSRIREALKLVPQPPPPLPPPPSRPADPATELTAGSERPVSKASFATPQPPPPPLPPPSKLLFPPPISIKSSSSITTEGKETFALNVHIELQNVAASSLRIEAVDFTFDKNVKPSYRTNLDIESKYRFPLFLGMSKEDPKREVWGRTCVLETMQTTKTWIAIDEAMSKVELDQRLHNKAIGKLRYRIYRFLGNEEPMEYEVRI